MMIADVSGNRDCLRKRLWRETAHRLARGLLLICVGAVCAWLMSADRAWADQNYSQQVFFENSLSPGNYFYSEGHVTTPSRLTLVDGKLPINEETFVSGPNALSLSWQSAEGGGWTAAVKLYTWRDRTISFPGTTLFFWVYAAAGLRAADLPHLALRDADGNFTAPLRVGAYARDLKPHTWIRIGIPLAAFQTASVHAFTARRLNTLILAQGAADSRPHTLLLDDIRIEWATGGATGAATGKDRAAPPPPRDVQARGWERHIDLTWKPGSGSDAGLAQYVIYRSLRGGPFRAIGVQRPGVGRYSDYVGDAHTTAVYRVTARTSWLRESAPSPAVSAGTHPMSDDALLGMVQEAGFRYYWEAAEPHSGMTRESTPGDDDIVAVGASGFGVMAIMVAAERGWITHEQAVARLLRITGFLAAADRYHGAWPHFLSGRTGQRLPVFDIYDNGADLVETSFLMEGLLAARHYFREDGAAGQALYAQITRLWLGVDWDWFRATPLRDALYWHWSPEYGFHIANRLTGWNEVMVTYVEAIASPAHGIPAGDYYSGWAGEGVGNAYANGKEYYGIRLPVGGGTGGPLFFTDYSFMGLDPHAVRDRFTNHFDSNYFNNNRAQALINQKYCEENRHGWVGYGADTWGLTAVDGPGGYVPYEPTVGMDDGTVAPTGALSAFPYAPEASMAALKHYYRDLGAQVWSIYGFRDAFNLQENWYSGITMGLNQAPMVVMIENGRSGLVWKQFMANAEVQHALQAIARQGD